MQEALLSLLLWGSPLLCVCLALQHDVDKHNQNITHQVSQDQALTNLFAGHETTATAVGFLLQVLTKHPAVMQRLREEQAAVMTQHGPAVSLEALEAMPYAGAVVKEVIRYRPPVPMVWRRALEDIEVGIVPVVWVLCLSCGYAAVVPCMCVPFQLLTLVDAIYDTPRLGWWVPGAAGVADDAHAGQHLARHPRVVRHRRPL